MQDDLAQKKCIPCEGTTPPLVHSESNELLSHVNQWRMMENRYIEKTIHMKNFAEAIEFVNDVAKIAEKEGHHPDMCVFDYNKVKITLSTHAIKGLSENDFILATKIDEVLRDQ